MGRCVVGAGLASPEVCTFVNSGRATSINAERGNLGTDKSVPYESVRIFSFVRLVWRFDVRDFAIRALGVAGIVGDGFIRPEICTLVNSGTDNVH